MEGVSNIAGVVVFENSSNNFRVECIFHVKPSDGDVEAISLIETQILSDVWPLIENLDVQWRCGTLIVH
ncbi:hypothetical protein GCM10007207_15610 [Asaia siamensis]|uniref:Uncharacterized protein n=1 Tax=Asaia siamensis TaxID=110479 RepID=A0ABQ1M0V9_9PROT|nr:hypothetical protein AA0323_0081 [Asaia siamensis NRIC 0323]GGC30958.1 hypothetical protein GCM10007207_15610 [Asaia siamensis]